VGRLDRGIPGAAAAMILIEPYSDRWPRQFEEIGGRLRAVLGDRALRIDHIGSTAVPGLAAKPVIDVQVAVGRLGDAQPLVDAGFEEIVGLRDHRPPGANRPASDWEKRLFNPQNTRSNVHVRVQGRANQRYALLFRDYLRTHQLSADAYAELKRGLAGHLSDRGTHADVKDPACDLIAIAAEAWAVQTAWDPGPSDA
jgi:GrpB-like predicted nucleotidyltransferase (UPF0157 family)